MSPTVINREIMPFGYTRSPLKLTRGDLKGLRHFGPDFICWNAVMYITSDELPLSTKTLLVSCPLMVSMIMKGSHMATWLPLHLIQKKTMSSSPVRWCLSIRCFIWTLLTCLWTAFLKDLYDPPATGPPVIILISPTTCLGWSQSSSLWSSIDLSSVRWRV